jgi:hypothetical protein
VVETSSYKGESETDTGLSCGPSSKPVEKSSLLSTNQFIRIGDRHPSPVPGFEDARSCCISPDTDNIRKPVGSLGLH